MAVKFLNNVNSESNEPLYKLTNSEYKDWVAGDTVGRIEFCAKDAGISGDENLVFSFTEFVPSEIKVTSYIEAVSDTDSLTPSGALVFGTSNSLGSSQEAIETMRLTSRGQLGINTSEPTKTLDVYGTMGVSGSVVLSNYASGLLQVDASGNVSVDSSTYLTSETFGASDVAFSLNGNDIIAGDSITLAGGLSYNPATDTLTQTDTQYTAGTGLDLSSNVFSIESDLRDGIRHIGKDNNNYIEFDVGGNGHMDFYVGGVWSARLQANGELHVKGDVVAFSSIF